MLHNVDESQAAIDDLVNSIKDEINVQLPCIISEVNADGTVDCLVIRHDEKKDVVFPNIPIRHMETTRAYIFLGIVKGDKGVVRFFDRSIENYKINSSTSYNNDDRRHSVNDSLFDYGFYPAQEAYAFPKDKNIAIGNKNGSFLMAVDDSGACVIKASSFVFDGPSTFNNKITVNDEISASGEITSAVDVKAANISLKEHPHGNGNLGQDTTPPK